MGTEKVELFGDPTEEILLEVRQSELAKMGLSVDDLAAADCKRVMPSYPLGKCVEVVRTCRWKSVVRTRFTLTS